MLFPRARAEGDYIQQNAADTGDAEGIYRGLADGNCKKRAAFCEEACQKEQGRKETAVFYDKLSCPVRVFYHKLHKKALLYTNSI